MNRFICGPVIQHTVMYALKFLLQCVFQNPQTNRAFGSLENGPETIDILLKNSGISNTNNQNELIRQAFNIEPLNRAPILPPVYTMPAEFLLEYGTK